MCCFVSSKYRFFFSIFDGNGVDLIRVVVLKYKYKYILIACAVGNRKATGLICKDFTSGLHLEGCRIAVMGSMVVRIRWWKEIIINSRRVGN